jgi:hypothetical protein
MVGAGGRGQGRRRGAGARAVDSGLPCGGPGPATSWQSSPAAVTYSGRVELSAQGSRQVLVQAPRSGSCSPSAVNTTRRLPLFGPTVTRPSGASPSCTPRQSSSLAATKPRFDSAPCTHLSALPRTTAHNARPSSTSSAPICACLSPLRHPPTGQYPRSAKARASPPQRAKRGLSLLATHGSKKDRCVSPRNVFLQSTCVTIGPQVSIQPILPAHASGPTSASISPAPPSSTSTSIMP